MRLIPIVAAAAAIACALPAHADTVVETVAIGGSVEYGLGSVNGSLFNPALGTLTAVSATFTGSYFLAVDAPGEPGLPSQATFSLNYDLVDPGLRASGNLGSFTGYLNGDEYFAQQGFQFSQNFLSIGNFAGDSPSQTGNLVDLDLGAGTRTHTGASSDFSYWTGDASFTFTYSPATTVPEPTSFAILATACVALAGCASVRRLKH